MCCGVISVIAASSLFSTFNLNLVLSSSLLSHCCVIIITASSPCYFTVISCHFTVSGRWQCFAACDAPYGSQALVLLQETKIPCLHAALKCNGVCVVHVASCDVIHAMYCDTSLAGSWHTWVTVSLSESRTRETRVILHRRGVMLLLGQALFSTVNRCSRLNISLTRMMHRKFLGFEHGAAPGV